MVKWIGKYLKPEIAKKKYLKQKKSKLIMGIFVMTE